MRAKDRQLAPHRPRSNKTLGHDVWWYEEHGGIAIYVGSFPDRQKRVALIEWRPIRHALARKDKP